MHNFDMCDGNASKQRDRSSNTKYTNYSFKSNSSNSSCTHPVLYVSLLASLSPRVKDPADCGLAG